MTGDRNNGRGSAVPRNSSLLQPYNKTLLVTVSKLLGEQSYLPGFHRLKPSSSFWWWPAGASSHESSALGGEAPGTDSGTAHARSVLAVQVWLKLRTRAGPGMVECPWEIMEEICSILPGAHRHGCESGQRTVCKDRLHRHPNGYESASCTVSKDRLPRGR